MADESKLGQRIRTYREQLDYPVETLAERSGVSADVIRAIENGDVVPILGTLIKLSRALGQRIGTFTDDQFKPDPVIVRAGEREAIKELPVTDKPDHIRYFRLGAGKIDRHMEPCFIELLPDASPAPSSHEGEEFILVHEGEVELRYGEEVFRLKPGDTACYNSIVNHIVTAAGDKPATIFGVVFMPF